MRRLAYLTGLVVLCGPLFAQVTRDDDIGFSVTVDPASGCQGQYVRMKLNLDLNLTGDDTADPPVRNGPPSQGWTYSLCLDDGLTILGGDAIPAFANYDGTFGFTDYKKIYFPGGDSAIFDDIEAFLLAEKDDPKCLAANKICGMFESFEDIDPAALTDTGTDELEFGRDIYELPSGELVVRMLPVQPDDLKVILGPDAAFNIVPCSEAPANPACRPPGTPRKGLPAYFSIYTISDSPSVLQRGLVLDVTAPPMLARNGILDGDVAIRLDGAEGTYNINVCGESIDGNTDVLDFLITASIEGSIENIAPEVDNVSGASVTISGAPPPAFELSLSGGCEITVDKNTGAVEVCDPIGVIVEQPLDAGGECGEPVPVPIGGITIAAVLDLPKGVSIDTVGMGEDVMGIGLEVDRTFIVNLPGESGNPDNCLTAGLVFEDETPFPILADTPKEVLSIALTADESAYDENDCAQTLTGSIALESCGGIDNELATWPPDPSATLTLGSPVAVSVEVVCLRPFIRGDGNADAKIDLADGVFVINWIFRGGPAPGCLDAADFDNSMGSSVEDVAPDISDAVSIFRYRLQRGARPACTPETPGAIPLICQTDTQPDCTLPGVADTCLEYGPCE